MKCNNIQAILFDIDGTLLDTTELIFRCYEHTITICNLSPKTRKEISTTSGEPLEVCYRQLFPNEDITKLSEIHMSFQEKNLSLSKRFNNVASTLRNLKDKGFKIAAVTTRSKRTSTKSLEINNIASFMDVIISREDVVNPKPHPDALIKALKHLNVSPDHAVMVGDTPIDIKAGKNAKMMTIGVSYGPLGNAVKSVDPDMLISDISEIISLIKH